MADREIESFLYGEARLMDEHRFDEWLALWEEGGSYWVPCNADDIDPSRQVSIIYDDYLRLKQRIDRLKSGTVQALDPRPRMRRVIGNIEADTVAGDTVTASSNFILGVTRGENQELWIGRSIHRLRRTALGFKIAHKKVLLTNSDQEMSLLQFLI
jgi:3-phenylpropionate/cinnamic acid dioxygenase small subunit